MSDLNLPNFLTVLRILLVPVLVVVLLGETEGGDVLAGIVFAVASFTDFLDGRLARSRDSVTNFGKLMDPIADKLLIIAALLSLVSLNRLEAWVAMVIIAREFAVTALRMAATQQGIVISASAWGKLKTLFQVAMVFTLIVVPNTSGWTDALVYATVVVTLLSGADYFFGFKRHVARARAERSKIVKDPSGAG